MAWLCGKIVTGRGGRKRRFLFGAVSGSVLYIVLYLSKSFITYRFALCLPLQAVLLTISQKAVVSGANAVVAVCVAVPLGLALSPAVWKLHLENNA